MEDNKICADNATAVPAFLEAVNAEEIASTFNYALLSAELGDYLRRKEEQLKNEYMAFTANCGAIFTEAQEKLSREKGGDGLFLKWIGSMGFKKDTVYRIVSVHKFRVSQIAKLGGTAELFDSLPKMLQYDISAPSAPPELVEQVMNGDITTHSEYIKLKKLLKEQQERADNAEKRLDANNGAIEKLSEINSELEKENKALKNRPVEVAVQTDEKALAEKNKEILSLQSKISEQEETIKDMEESFNDYVAITDKKAADLKAQISALESASDSGSGKGFFIAVTTQEYAGLLSAVGESCGKTSRAYAILSKARMLTLK